MTVLPFIDIKATPIRRVRTPPSSLAKLLPHIADHSNKLSSKHNPQPSTSLPKIKIISRSDEILKQLPHKKTASIEIQHSVWKPLTRELRDYDYLWEPLQREDIRHQYDFYIAPQRITASRPDEPYKMTTSFETEDRHYHNYKRVRGMQQRQWNKEHMQYTIYPYADMIEREIYNKHIRSTLKEQIEEKSQTDKNEQEMKNFECRIVIEKDRLDLEQEKQKQKQKVKSSLLTTVRNKELMENKWEYDQWKRSHQWHVERTILADDPVNWSKTMT